MAREGNSEAVQEWLSDIEKLTQEKQKQDKPKQEKLAQDKLTQDKLQRVLLLATLLGQPGHEKISELIIATKKLNEEALLPAFRYACRYGHMKIAKLLISYVDITDETKLEEILAETSVNGQVEVMEWLIEEAKLPLKEAVKWRISVNSGGGDLDAVAQLAEKVKTGDKKHIMSQALRFACYSGRIEVVRWLLQKQEELDIGSKGLVWTFYGEMSAMTAACCNAHFDIVKLLVEADQMALEQLSMPLGSRKDTVLHFAVWCVQKDFTELHKACDEGNINVVNSIFSDQGDAFVDVQSNAGHTPLHRACIQGHIKIIKLLMSAFARTDITNEEMLTPADIAKKSGNNEEVINILNGITDINTGPDDTSADSATNATPNEIVTPSEG